MSKQPEPVKRQVNQSGKLYAACQRHASYYHSRLSHANQLYVKGGDAIKEGLALLDREWPNIETGQAWAALQAETEDTATELCGGYVNDSVAVLLLRQHLRERIHWLEPALTAAQRLKKRALEAAMLGNLGLVYAGLGELRRAIAFDEQQLVITREIGDRHSEGTALGNLGVAYRHLGEPRRAIAFHEQHQAIAREISDRRGEGNALSNLGNIYLDMGEPRRTIEFYEQHRAIAREIGDWRGEGNTLSNMSLVLYQLGEREQAILNLEAALKIYEQIESPSTESVRKKLAEWRGR